MPDIVIREIAPTAAPRAPPAGGGFYCNFLWDSLTVLSDGKVTCGFDDPFGRRSFGNIGSASVSEIFNGEGVRRLRNKLLSGSRCETCHLYSKVESLGVAGLPPIPRMPSRLILETTIRCNLRCRNTSCDLNNDRAFKVREQPFLSFDLYRKLMDEAGPHLGAMYFFNYGEPFLHPRAVDMLAYAKGVNPAMCIASSTNGIMLARGEAPRRIVEEQLLFFLNFTIAGCDDESYQAYHKGGSFEEAVEGMRRVVEEKRRRGATLPTVQWRYLLFNWNDSDEQIARARRLAAEIGVDAIKFFLCSAPLEGRTRLRAPGTPGFEAIKEDIDYEVHYLPDPFADAGLYLPEHDRTLGTYAWTSRVATIEVRPVGGAATIHLARTEAVQQAGGSVRITTPWETRAANVGIGEWGANVLVAAGAPEAPFPVTIEAEAVFIPYRHGAGDDYREMGAMLSLAFPEPRAEPMEIPPRRHVPVDALVESDGIPIPGLAAATSVWVRNGEYALDADGFTDAASVAFPGQRLRVRHASARGPGMLTTSVVTLGGQEVEFTSVTSTLGSWEGEVELSSASEPRAHSAAAMETAQQFVARQYREILGREGDAGGLEWWLRRLEEGAERSEVVEAFLSCHELGEREGRLAGLYLAFMPRIPDYEGLSASIERLRQGHSLESIAAAMAARGEFLARYGALGDAAFLDSAWEGLAGRKPLAAERDGWVPGSPRAEAMLALCGSAAYRMRNTHRIFVVLAYAFVLQRSPDVVGYGYWVDALDDGRPRRALIAAMLDSPEYAARLARTRETTAWA